LVLVVELLAGLFGLLIGSFLNVCIYRWPRDLSVVHPRSRCPECERQIAWYDNVPVASYVLLGGRCRGCAARIHWRYPAVELLTAISFVWFAHQYGLTPEAAKYCVLAAILIALAFTDADTRILPDELTIGGTLAGVVFAAFVPVANPIWPWRISPRLDSVMESLAGALICSGAIWLAGWLFEKLRHKEGLGFGDVKMLAMAGAFLGVQGALLTVILGSILGSVAGLLYIKLTGKDAGTYQLPFGTFLAIAAFVVAMQGAGMIGWYDQTLR
jgi:leader peptidase (prepilin peptidase) / N-methyltransferase